MEDIAPKLRKAVLKRFHQYLEMDPQARAYRKKLENGKLNRHECGLYVDRIAKCASKAVQHILTPDALPDGILYWNIAEAALTPLYEETFDYVIDIAVKQKEQETRKIGRQVRIERPEFPAERIKSYLNMVVNRSLKEKANETSQ